MFNSSKEIADLKSQVETLTEQAATAATAQAELQTKLDSEVAKSAQLAADIEALKTSHAKALEDQAAQLKADHAAEIEAKVSAGVIERCAAAGVEPVATDPKASQNIGKPTVDPELKGRARAAAAFNIQFAK